MSEMGFSIGLGLASLGLGISPAPWRTKGVLLALLIAAAVIGAALPFASQWDLVALRALGAITILSAALVFFSQRAALLRSLAAAGLGLCLGVMFGAGTASLADLAFGFAFLLLLLPADRLRARGLQVVTHVVASWVITAGFINLVFVELRPVAPITDHML